MDRSSGFGSTPRYYAPYSDSLSLRLPYSVKLATERKSLTHYTKGTQSPLLQTPSGCLAGPPDASRIRSNRQSPSYFKQAFTACSFHSFLNLLSRIAARCSPKESKTLEAGAPTVCMHAVSGSISLPSRGSFRLSLTVLVHYRSTTSI